MLGLAATLPIVIVGVLMVVFMWPASRAMPVGWLAALVIAFFAWAIVLLLTPGIFYRDKRDIEWLL